MFHWCLIVYFLFQVWINPTLKVLDYSKVTFPEGCESMRGYSAEVARYTRVQLSGEMRSLSHQSNQRNINLHFRNCTHVNSPSRMGRGGAGQATGVVGLAGSYCST